MVKAVQRALGVGLALYLAGVAMVHAADRNQTLILGEITDNPKKQAGVLKPMVEYAVSKMGDVGITAGDIIMFKNREEMIKGFQEGKIDWATDTPFPALAVVEKTGAELLVRRWKKGVGEYKSVFFTHKDNPIAKLEDLKGKKVAFQDSSSTTAFFVPMAMIKQAGLGVAELAGPRDPAPADKVGYVFGKDEVNQVAWVQRKIADVGVFSNYDWEEIPDAAKAEMKVFHESKMFPRGVEFVRKDLDPKVKAKLKEVLLKADSDPAAADALKAYGKTKKFDDIAGVQEGINYSKELLKAAQ
ncbi:MAG: phosphate/phosphite/phosphonate ABC transporter substrate-binding protein [Magnetococcales bacterium]|nr:phosphate/phosphite/phosphonate ABC transporter substrate-binding protein [Magnetococcales bacterium]NGZ26937.1 phosphate/phosphite/phosphonate ABC transporter substrate-binding protein [Magnetococcales bacterium]